MPVAEILAGIALVKSSVDFIKSNIDTCKDIGEIGGAIDGLLRGQQDVNKKQGKRGLGVREQFDTSHIARETIDAKIAAEQLQEVANMVNLRFGPNTWKEILEERARRIAEQKEAIRLAKIEKAKADKELWADVKMALAVIGAVIGMMCLYRWGNLLFTMTHAFLLILYLGGKIISQDMHFYSVDNCKYYAERLNNQPPVPNRMAGEDQPKTRKYIAVCEPRKVDPKRVSIYK